MLELSGGESADDEADEDGGDETDDASDEPPPSRFRWLDTGTATERPVAAATDTGE